MSNYRPAGSKGQRQKIDIKDYYNVTAPNLQVTARPTDPFTGAVKAQVTDNSASMESLVATVRSFQQAGFGYLDSKQKENETQAKVDAATGKPNAAPSGVSGGFGIGYDDAYYATLGEAAGSKYYAELTQTASQANWFADSDNPDAAWAEHQKAIYGKHFESNGSNQKFMLGAAPTIEQAHLKANAEFQQARYQRVRGDFVDAVGVNQRSMIQTYRDTEDDIDPVKLRKVLADGWNYSVKPTGYMDRSQYSAALITSIGEEAMAVINSDDPNKFAKAWKLLEMYDIPDSDTGASWSEMRDKDGGLKFQSEISKYQGAVTKAMQAEEQAGAAAVKERRDATEKDLFSRVVMSRSIPRDEKIQAILANETLTAAQAQRLAEKAISLEDDLISEDIQDVVRMRTSIELATSAEALEALRSQAVEAAGGTLTRDTFEEINSRITARKDHLTSEARAGRTLDQEDRTLGYSMLEKVVGKQGLMDDPTAAAFRMDHYGRRYFQRVKGGGDPTEVANQLIQEYARNVGVSEIDMEGPPQFGSPEEVRAAVEAGKITGGEGIKELKKLQGVTNGKPK